MSPRSNDAMLEKLELYQQQLKGRLKSGCQPSEYYVLADLNTALDLVIQRLKNVNNEGNHHGV